MITEEQLQEAIAECNGQRHPNAETCLKLASYYTIKNEMFPKKEPERTIDNGYSYAAAPAAVNSTIDYDGESEFAEAVNGRDINEVVRIFDEVMKGLFVVNMPLYKRIMRELTE